MHTIVIRAERDGRTVYIPSFQDIVDLLPIVAHYGWRRERHLKGALRTHISHLIPDGVCPLCALANEVLGTNYTTDAFGAMRSLSDYGALDCASLYEVRSIMDAADRPNGINAHAIEEALK